VCGLYPLVVYLTILYLHSTAHRAVVDSTFLEPDISHNQSRKGKRKVDEKLDLEAQNSNRNLPRNAYSRNCILKTRNRFLYRPRFLDMTQRPFQDQPFVVFFPLNR
jgi:hypothetical protein